MESEMTNWPETILMARAWFEGDADAALAELEHRAELANRQEPPLPSEGEMRKEMEE